MVALPSALRDLAWERHDPVSLDEQPRIGTRRAIRRRRWLPLAFAAAALFACSLIWGASIDVAVRSFGASVEQPLKLIPAAFAAAGGHGKDAGGNSHGNGGGNGNSNGNGGGNGNSNGNSNGNGGGNGNSNGSGGGNGNSNGSGGGNGNSNGNGGGNGNSNGNSNGTGGGSGNSNGNSNGNGAGNGNSNGNSNGNGGGDGSSSGGGNSDGAGAGSSGSSGNAGSSGGSHEGGAGNGGGNHAVGGPSTAGEGASAAFGPTGPAMPDADSAEDSLAGGAVRGKTIGPTGEVGHDFASNEIVLVSSSRSDLARAVRLGFRPLEERRLPSIGISVMRLQSPPGMPTLHALAVLRGALPGRTVDVDSLYQPYHAQGLQLSSEALPLPSRDYPRRMMGWPADPSCGTGLRIGMIDTAAARDRPRLAGQSLHQRSFAGDPATSASGETAPGEHGTAIALLLAGRAEQGWSGLLPAADLFVADVFGGAGKGAEASAVSIAAALDWMVASRVSVVNLSVSGSANQLLALAIRRAADRGTVIVAAAGNRGPSAPPAYPAALPGVIAVTAVDDEARVFAGANRGDYIDFSAPGVRIWVPGGGPFGRLETGTSFAAPFVAALAAVELSRGGKGGREQLVQHLAARSLHLGPPGRNPIYGYGLPRLAGGCGGAIAASP